MGREVTERGEGVRGGSGERGNREGGGGEGRQWPTFLPSSSMNCLASSGDLWTRMAVVMATLTERLGGSGMADRAV